MVEHKEIQRLHIGELNHAGKITVPESNSLPWAMLLYAIVSVVNSVLLKPLAGVDTERLVKLSEKFPSGSGFARARTYREWRKLTDIIDELGARQ